MKSAFESDVCVPASSRGRWLLLWVFVLALVPASLCAQLGIPTVRDKVITKHVALYLEQVHVRRWKLNDIRSGRMFDSFLKALDPQRMYFSASDVEGFRKDRLKIDNFLKSGSLDFAFEVGGIFLQRVEECTTRAKKLASQEHDFSVDEFFVSDRSEAPYAEGGKGATELWRKRVKALLLEKLADGKTEEEARTEVAKLYANFSNRMQRTDGMELLQIFLTSATMTYDPHTTYMSPDTLENFQISMRLELEGIGAALQSIDGYTVVSQIIPGGAAAREGSLKLQDKILAVAQGDSPEFVDLLHMKLSNVVKLIRGKKGTKVRMKIRHADANQEETLSIIRAKVVLSDREAHGEVLEVTQGKGGQPVRVGVIVLPSFYMDMAAAGRGVKDFKSTTRDVARILKAFKKGKGVDAVVVDLRINGGGALSEAISLTGLFIDTGPVVQIKKLRGRVDTRSDKDNGVAWAGPLVVLTSKFSASASEIFAGALQDYGRAVVVGDRSTHGKGTVQQLMDLGRNRSGQAGKLGALKITISQFYRPSGDSTQNKGVIPDIELPAVSSYLDGEAELDYAIEFDTVPKAKYTDLGLAEQATINSLQEKSQRRRGGVEEFNRIEEDIVRYQKLRDRKKIPLQRARYEAEKKKLNPRGADEEKKDPDKPVPPVNENEIKRDFYLEEVLSIAADYARTFKPGDAGSYERLARAALLLGEKKAGQDLVARGLRKHPGNKALLQLKAGRVE
ncbi:MAG: carboxy terminal-processing peptidase [Planctomycetota bacterium]